MSANHSSNNKRERLKKHRDADSMSPREQLLGTLVVLLILLLAILLRSMY